MSSILTPTQIKKTRQSAPKAKTGCWTCKTRRVKCDERKPACERCTKTGRKCDGYGVLFLTPGMSISTQGGVAEKRSLRYYLDFTGEALSGYYEPSFWRKLVLQVATTDPALKHGIVAMGALHEAYAGGRLDNPSGSVEQGFAIVQYTKAISLLRRSLAQGTQDPQTALISCIVFASFESIRGHFSPALVHLKSGLDILRHLSVKSAQNHVIPTIMTPALARLTIQAVLYLKSIPKPEQKAFALKIEQFTKLEADIDTFITLEQARDSLSHTLCSLVYISLMLDCELPLGAQRSVAQVYKTVNKQLCKWNTGFENLLQSRNLTLDNRDLRGSVLLKIQYTTARIMADAIYSTFDDPQYFLYDRGRYASFINGFATIVNLSRSLVAASRVDFESGKSRSPMCFSADWGVVLPLHYSFIKCPDSAIRTAALDVLRQCRRREGMWDSQRVCGIAGLWLA